MILSTPPCPTTLCSIGKADSVWRHCCDARCFTCGGPNCSRHAALTGITARDCCPSQWHALDNRRTCATPHDVGCDMPPELVNCAAKIFGLPHTSASTARHDNGSGPRPWACSCHGDFSHAFYGRCLPSFMIIGSQKAATSKLRWYLSRHPAISIPKEELLHKGPSPFVAWDTSTSPNPLSNVLSRFDDVCNSTSTITGLKMPDYIVMSSLVISHFHRANPQLRIILTLREPVVRMYSYFAMQLRLGWSPINHMGRNPCMQQRLRALLQRKQSAHGGDTAGERAAAAFTAEEIMGVNLECVRPCYADGGSGAISPSISTDLDRSGATSTHVSPTQQPVEWHDESIAACRNIYFTPLVHSMYAMHLRRWLRVFPESSLLLLRFDDLVLRPLDVLAQVTDFLNIQRLDARFKVEIGRANYTTVERLLASRATDHATLRRLEAFFEPHNEALSRMFPGRSFW